MDGLTSRTYQDDNLNKASQEKIKTSFPWRKAVSASSVASEETLHSWHTQTSFGGVVLKPVLIVIAPRPYNRSKYLLFVDGDAHNMWSCLIFI